MEKVDEHNMKLPRDVMIDILKRLQAKSLMRFKCVSKTWYNLISSADFISIHYHHGCVSHHFVLLKRYLKNDEQRRESIYYSGKNVLSFYSNDESFISIAPNTEYNDNYIGVSIVGPCNGIVCVASYRSIVLYNPTLREFWELPPSILPPSPYLSANKKLNYHMAMTIGIGFDPSTDDYKVVRILNPSDEYVCEDVENHYKLVSKVEIYNLSTNYWRKIEDLQCLVDPRRCFQVLFNGAFHWRGTNLSPGEDYWIVSFNFITELFHTILFPEGLDIKPDTSLVVLNNSLALICYSRVFYSEDLELPQSIDIWLMQNYPVRESWIKRFTVGPMVIETPLSVWKNDTELMMEGKKGKLASFNLNTEEIKEFDMSGIPETLEVIVCKESLISIKK